MLSKIAPVVLLSLALAACSTMPRNPDQLPPLPDNVEIISMAGSAYKNRARSNYEAIHIDSIEKARVFPDGYDYVACVTIGFMAYKTIRTPSGWMEASDKLTLHHDQYGMMFRFYPDDGWIAPLFRGTDEKMGARTVSEICTKTPS